MANGIRWFFILFTIVALTGCGTQLDENIFTHMTSEEEVLTVLNSVFVLGTSSVEDVSEYVNQQNLQCSDFEERDYSPEFSPTYHDGLLVCWVDAPDIEAPSELDWVTRKLTAYSFRIVFRFEGETLTEIEVVLDSRGI